MAYYKEAYVYICIYSVLNLVMPVFLFIKTWIICAYDLLKSRPHFLVVSNAAGWTKYASWLKSIDQEWPFGICLICEKVFHLNGKPYKEGKW